MSAQLETNIFSFYEEITLTKNGNWLSNHEDITHDRTIMAFSRNIYRCKDGFEIRIGNERKSIHVEDTLYFITSINGSPELGFTLHTNDGRIGELDPTTLQYKPGRLTCKIPDSKTGVLEEAKFLSAAYYEFLKYITQDENEFSITIEGQKIPLAAE